MIFKLKYLREIINIFPVLVAKATTTKRLLQTYYYKPTTTNRLLQTDYYKPTTTNLQTCYKLGDINGEATE